MSRESIGLSEELLDYLRVHSVSEQSEQAELRNFTANMEHAAMQISPEQGKFMQFLVQLTGATRCLEVGVFTGYSALSVALALPPNGIITAFDVSEEWTRIAREYWSRAGVDAKIDLRLESGVSGLGKLIDEGMSNSYDFAFIDADKVNYAHYYNFCTELVRPGGLIVIDNVLWSGKVTDLSVEDADTVAIRQINDIVHRDTRTDSCMIPVGDGLMLARVL